jgi:hypothetical protein
LAKRGGRFSEIFYQTGRGISRDFFGRAQGERLQENKEAGFETGLLDEKGHFLDSRWSLS